MRRPFAGQHWAVASLLAVSATLAGCSLLGNDPAQVSLGLEGQLAPYQLRVGEEAALIWQVRTSSGTTLNYASDDLAFGSSSSDVATIEYSWDQDPYVRARRAGQCTISAVLTGEGVSGSFALTVLP